MKSTPRFSATPSGARGKNLQRANGDTQTGSCQARCAVRTRVDILTT